MPDGLGVNLLVDSDEAGGLLLADVTRDVVVAHDRKLEVERRDLGCGFGHQVGMEGIGHRNPEPNHACHVIRIAAGGVYHVLTTDRSQLGDDIPLAIGTSPDLQHPVSATGAGPQVAGSGEHRVRGTRRIDVAVSGGPDGTDDALDVVEGVSLGNEVRTHPVHLQTRIGGDAELALQPVHLDRFVSDSERAGFVPRCRHSGLGLEGRVEVRGVFSHRGQRVAGHGVGDLPSGMPGRAGGELGLLDEERVDPALVGEVVEDAGSHDAATDDDNPRSVGHGLFGCCQDGLLSRLER